MTTNCLRIRTFNETHNAVAFPLGGIGTGNVSLGARGEPRDWEIFNKSNKNNRLPNTFFAIRTQVGANTPEVRVLEGPLQAPHLLSHGYHPSQNAGLPRMAKTHFEGEYPLASIQFEDSKLPVDVKLDAYTPLLPLNPEDSGLPCAILTYTITNRSPSEVHLTVVGSIVNPVGGIQFDQYLNIAANKKRQSVNNARYDEGMRGLLMHTTGIDPNDLDFGSIGLATDHPDV